MITQEPQTQAVIENLRDAECSQELITKFIRSIERKQTAECLALLAEHRRTLLNNCHMKQRKIDSLDDLIRKMKQELK